MSDVDATILDIQLAQDLLRAHHSGRPITNVVARLQRASLAGLMEYGCLRWEYPDVFPSLPRAVKTSPLGQALTAVCSELGLRQTGAPGSPSRDTEIRESEFYVVADEGDLVDNRAFQEFLVRFEFSSRSIGIPRQTATALQAALEEMAANVVNHANAPVPALVGYEVRGRVAQFSVVDVGRGILSSLRENPAYETIAIHSEAIKLALRGGVSRFASPVSRGFGFNAVFKSLNAQWGRLRFRSGEGIVQTHGLDLVADQAEERDAPYLAGFQVAVACRVSQPK